MRGSAGWHSGEPYLHGKGEVVGRFRPAVPAKDLKHRLLGDLQPLSEPLNLGPQCLHFPATQCLQESHSSRFAL
jgi:hypothetical protein